ncbi:MAG: hypothetical protein IJS61_11570 [Firmicutes bacterium]|nr:hypothetical protein [Bacillota bacterium]
MKTNINKNIIKLAFPLCACFLLAFSTACNEEVIEEAFVNSGVQVDVSKAPDRSVPEETVVSTTEKGETFTFDKDDTVDIHPEDKKESPREDKFHSPEDEINLNEVSYGSVLIDAIMEDENSKKEPEREPKPGVDIDVNVERDGNMIKMLVSPEFFGINQGEDSIRAEVESWGGHSVNINDSGYVSAYMSVEEYESYIDKLKNKVNDTVKKITDKYDVIKDISFNDNCTDFTVLCDKKIGTEKAISAFDIYVDAAAYQVFSGKAASDAFVNITYIDKDSGETIDFIDSSQICVEE